MSAVSLTIIIPSFRVSQSLAMETVIKQTVPTDVLVVLDKDEEGAGPTRNRGIAITTTDWVGFLDDDDRLDPHYHEWLDKEAEDNDMVIFQMKNGLYTIPGHMMVPNLKYNWVGISFAMRTEVAREMPFYNMIGEDFDLIQRCIHAGYKVKISPHVAYFVRQSV